MLILYKNARNVRFVVFRKKKSNVIIVNFNKNKKVNVLVISLRRTR